MMKPGHYQEQQYKADLDALNKQNAELRAENDRLKNQLEISVKNNIELFKENGRLRSELDEARAQWRVFAGMMEPLDECMCLEPQDVDEEDDPSSHSQYCPVYLQAYALAMAAGEDTPD